MERKVLMIVEFAVVVKNSEDQSISEACKMILRDNVVEELQVGMTLLASYELAKDE